MLVYKINPEISVVPHSAASLLTQAKFILDWVAALTL